MNLKILLTIFLFFGILSLHSSAQEDSTKPFRHIKGTDKWETTTPVVRAYATDISDSFYKDSIIDAQRLTIDSLMDAVEQVKTAYLQQKDYSHSLEVRNKDKQILIDSLSRPVLIETKKSSSSLFEYDGIYANIGTFYKFSGSIPVNKDQILNSLKYFVSLDIQWVLLGKLKTALEILIPLEARAKLGLKL